ncbi:phosphate ABC transporter permease PstA [Deinococcus sp. KNUC1210]|uniref:phosphate ABC transporter permease PstA n=1 Tax=Deinococcus sp. KNUC1210 TaxID=2917691 RepID=UPI001EF089F0|nr:phosphate ABC transporter permease PstA [Deinococcus sp. KNUC1210]ULH15152.1 phosphate ABC transporter permease PstA [Deinococcus sp. KNUC1210]
MSRTLARSVPRGQTLSTGRKTVNLFMGFLISLGTLIVVAPLIWIFVYLITQGAASLSTAFFTHIPAPVGEAGGGYLNAISGSLIMLAIAAVIGVIVGVAGGVFLAEFPRHPMMPTIRMLSDVLSGIPAIVVGLVVYSLVVVNFGYSGFAGGLALGLLMIPIVVRTSEEVLKLVPLAIREAGLALGLPQWKVILNIVLPAATSGIVTGVMLALARVAGEAAPLLFTAFGNNLLNLNPGKPMSALPQQIFIDATSGSDSNVTLAKAGSLVLIVLIFLASLAARTATRRR